jgi:hypothetical protein
MASASSTTVESNIRRRTRSKLGGITLDGDR